MPRVTSIELNEIIKLKTSVPADPFIEVASSMVDEHCTDSGYPESKLKLIELWLSAHFYAVRESRFETDQVSSLRTEFQSRVDLGLNVTHYGQQAMIIDSAGNLAVLNNSVQEATATLEAQGGKPTIKWLGRSRK